MAWTKKQLTLLLAEERARIVRLRAELINALEQRDRALARARHHLARVGDLESQLQMKGYCLQCFADVACENPEHEPGCPHRGEV